MTKLQRCPAWIAAALWLATLMLYAGVALPQSHDGSFTLSTSVNGDGTLTPTLSWSTTPEALGCEATGDSEWEGAKPASGSVTLSPRPTSQPRAFALVCQWPEDAQAFMTWTPPTQNTDGSPLTDLAGYRVFWGQDPGSLSQTAQIDDPAATSFTVANLTPATWFFGVRAFTSIGAESAMSNIASKTTSAGAQWSQQTGIKVPVAPVLQQ